LLGLGKATANVFESFVSWSCGSTDRIKVVFGAMGLIILAMFLWTAYQAPSFIRAFTSVVFYIALFGAIAFILVAAYRKTRTK